MPAIKSLRKIAKDYGITIEYRCDVYDTEYIEIAYSDDHYNVHIGKIIFDGNGDYHYFKIETLDIVATDFLVACIKEILTIIKNEYLND